MKHWVTIWAQAHTDLHIIRSYLKGKTMRTSLISCVNGEKLRLRFSNREGRGSFVLENAAVTVNGQAFGLTFDGSSRLTLAPGKYIYCDEISCVLRAGDALTLTAYFSRVAVSGNQVLESTIYSTAGNYVHDQEFVPGKAIIPRYRVVGIPPITGLAGAEVLTGENPRIIACFGDSITQQSHWVAPLNQTFFLRNDTARALNMGIGGNRALSGDCSGVGIFGRPGLERFAEDVLERPGVTDVIFALGTNDIGKIVSEEDFVKNSAENIFAGLCSMAGRANAQGIRVYFATVTPRMGSAFYDGRQEALRRKLNELIRRSDCAGVIDFDAAVRNPEDPEKMLLWCDSGDHLHPGPAGGLRMAKEALRVLDAPVV